MTWKPTIGRDAITRDNQHATDVREIAADPPHATHTLVAKVDGYWCNFTREGRIYGSNREHAFDLVGDWHDAAKAETK